MITEKDKLLARMPNIFRPTYSKRITQKFGENLACAKLDTYGRMAYPQVIRGAVAGICSVGYKSVYKLLGLKGHNGLDIKTYNNEPVYHCANFHGIMKTEVDSAGGVGVDVISKHTFPCLECGGEHHVKIRYWHLNTATGWDDREIKPGDIIGLSGNTGLSSGTHLHFAPKYCNQQGEGIHKENGYYGAYWEDSKYTHYMHIRESLSLKPEVLTLAQATSKLISQAEDLLRKILSLR